MDLRAHAGLIWNAQVHDGKRDWISLFDIFAAERFICPSVDSPQPTAQALDVVAC